VTSSRARHDTARHGAVCRLLGSGAFLPSGTLLPLMHMLTCTQHMHSEQ
jgi:hypothetical protein